jgi:hypothetical protein
VIDYEAAEPLIEALLAPLRVEGCQVRGMPDEAQKQGLAATGGPVIVHGWFGATPAGNGSLDGMALPLSNRIVITVRTPKLRGPLGQYQLPGRIRGLLQGAKLPGIGRLDYAGWQMVERSSGNGAGYEGMLVFTLLSMS